MSLVAVLFSIKVCHTRTWFIFIISNSVLWPVGFLYWLQELRWMECNVEIPFCLSSTPSSLPTPKQCWVYSDISGKDPEGTGWMQAFSRELTCSVYLFCTGTGQGALQPSSHCIFSPTGKVVCSHHLIDSKNRGVRSLKIARGTHRRGSLYHTVRTSCKHLLLLILLALCYWKSKKLNQSSSFNLKYLFA